MPPSILRAVGLTALLLLTAENLFDRRSFMFFRNPGRMVSAGVRLRY